MFKSHIRFALRHLIKRKGYTFLNMAGLSLGLASFLLILLYVYDEYSYDRYNQQAENIYRVHTQIKFGNNRSNWALSPFALGQALQQRFPEIQKCTHLAPVVGLACRKGDKDIPESGGYFADTSFFDFFSIRLLKGNPKTALSRPNSLILTQSLALKYFQTTDVLGKTMTLSSDGKTYTITGVMEEMPEASHFHARVLLPITHNGNSLNTLDCCTYLLLKPHTDYKRLDAKINTLYHDALAKDGIDYTQFSKSGDYLHLSIFPLTSIHLYSNQERELEPNSDISYVYIFSAIALLILMMACCNFINLATARSTERAKEVGVQKVLGSTKGTLITRFLTESLLLTIGSGLAGLLLAWLLLPLFNEFSGKNISLPSPTITAIIPTYLALTFGVGIISGAYPAFYLSRFSPISAFKGGTKGKSLFRNMLVTAQFAISLFLIISSMAIFRQLNYMQNKDLGYNRSQVLLVKNVGKELDHPYPFLQSVLQLPGVQRAALTDFLPTGTWRNPMYMNGNAGQDQVQIESWSVDPNYIPTLDMHVKEGRNFSTEMATDSSAIILNETAVKQLTDIHHSPIGQVLQGLHRYHIIGVIKDFNFSSLRDNITPVILTQSRDTGGTLVVRILPGQIRKVLTGLNHLWAATSAREAMDFSFMDQDFDAQYQSEQRMGKLFLIMSGLAILIACLGLFGLASYAAERREKELSIRKVLGASPRQILGLLSKEYVGLLLLAICIAMPVTAIIMEHWLQSFAYRANLDLGIFMVGGIILMLTSMFTVAVQSIKTTLASPLPALKSEG
jgi:putative ABC transport system permease protein